MAAQAHPPLPPVSADRAATPVRPTKSLVVGSVLVAAVVMLAAVALLVHLYDNATNQARQTLTSLDIVLAEQTEQALDTVDLTATQLSVWVEHYVEMRTSIDLVPSATFLGHGLLHPPRLVVF